MELAFDIPTYLGRLDRVRARMRQAGLDGLVVTMPDSIHWLTGYDTIGYLWSQALVIDGSGDEPLLITRTTEEPGARETCWLRSPRFYDIALEHPSEVLAAALRDRGLGAGRVGIDLQAFTLLPVHWDALRATLAEVAFSDASLLVPEERLIKSAAELQYQRQAAEMADHAMRVALEAVRPGISEVELAGIASRALGEAGSEYAAIPPMVVSGRRSALVHAMPSRKVLARGDVVCVELAGVCHRYHAVVMRTAVIGQPWQRLVDVTACLQSGLQAAYAACVAGNPVHLADDACNQVLARLDLVRRRCHRIGYSLGVAYPPGWLEPMVLVSGDEHRFAPGMSFTLEPNLTLADEGFGLKLGETALCGEAGTISLSRLDHGLAVVE